MTRFLLIRHAAVDLADHTIAGRAPGIHLTPAGHEQAERLIHELAQANIGAIYSSPQDRARETAQWIADDRKLKTQIAPALDELDYGEWTGDCLERLSAMPRWQAFNSIRSCTRILGGELIVEVQARVVDFMDRVHEPLSQGGVVLVSHGDVIRAALAYYLSFPLDLMLRLEISPASISIVELGPKGPSIRCINRTGEQP
jgi:broad specificity phosphatase PhoE